MTRVEILEKAKAIVCGERERQYGNPEDNFKAIAAMWTAYLGGEVVFEGKDVAMMMVLLKVVRMASGKVTEDGLVDIAGYAACAGEVANEAGD